jgi:hypothetical protein
MLTRRLAELPPALGRFFLRYYVWGILLIAGYHASHLDGRFIRGMIWSDAEGYYLYLPALFIHGGFEGLPVRTVDQFPLYPGTEKRLTKYNYGVALMQSPFFFAAHGLTKLGGQEADGYGPYYVRGIQAAGLLYGLLGLLLLRRVLERHFQPIIVMATLVGLYFGTNLFHYMVQEPGMSHIYSFFLFGLFLYYTPRFWEQPSARLFGGMGLLLGLIVLIRPTNIVLLLYLLLYGLRDWAGMRQRGRFIQQHFRALLWAPAASLLVFLPQFAYWYHLSGHWLLYSYGDEGFIYWRNPQLYQLLFDIKNGWLLFSPMAGLALLGCALGSWKNRYDIAAITLILLISLYAFSSWWSWWFGGALGQRSMVEFYTLLAFPYAYFTAAVFRQPFLTPRFLYLAFWLLSVAYSILLTLHYIGPHYDWEHWQRILFGS